MQEINAWLQSGKDFETGKALYIEYGNNSTFKSLLNNQGATPFTIKKLGAELKKLAPAPPAITHDAPPIPIVATVPPPAEVQEAEIAGTADQSKPQLKSTSEYPKYLQLKELLKTLYRQMDRNRTELDLGTKQDFLLLCAKQILSLDQKIKDVWGLIDYYDEQGCFPVIKATVEEARAKQSPAEEIQLLRQSTSKAKTRLKNPKCRDVEATQALILKNNKRIIELGGKVKS